MTPTPEETYERLATLQQKAEPGTWLYTLIQMKRSQVYDEKPEGRYPYAF